jgi:nucleotide-binding universal stress UspA family protein
MSNTELNRPIVVGVDGSKDALHALDWAAAEAARHSWPLQLVYAYLTPVAALPAIAVTLPVQSDEGQHVLAEAKDRITDAYPDLHVTIAQHGGKAPHVLLDASKGARMLVVGREGLGRVAELVLGSVSLAVASHATIPVAVIPAAWVPPNKPYGRVVLGIDGSENCSSAAHFAFQAAAEKNAELTVVYAWHQPTHRPDNWTLGTDDPHVRDDFERALVASIGDLQGKYPDVKVTVVDEVDHPALVLERQAANADMVVIGGRGHGTVTGMLLGSVARAIIRHLDNPVIVVHQNVQ